MKPIAHIHTDFPAKFGIPRQSGLVSSLSGVIVFTPEFRNPEALRGLEAYSHLWLIWQFSQAVCSGFSPTVRPPRLGGNRRMGVFATRSPFRPNPIGLSSVALEKIELQSPNGPLVYVLGADLMDNTPIYDIKPYLPFTDSHPDARAGFAEKTQAYALSVVFPEELLLKVPEAKRCALTEILRQDPRPSYQTDPHRIYGFCFAGLGIKFTVCGDVLTVRDVFPA